MPGCVLIVAPDIAAESAPLTLAASRRMIAARRGSPKTAACVGDGLLPLRGYPGGALSDRKTARDRPCVTTQNMSRRTRLVGPPRRSSMLSQPHPISEVLARALRGGVWTVPAMARRAALALGRRDRRLRSLARTVIAAFSAAPDRPDVDLLAEFLSTDPTCLPIWTTEPPRSRGTLRVRRAMRPAAGTPCTWDMPALTTTGALAAWLDIEPRELDWLADCQGRARRVPLGPLHNYHYHWLVSPRGKSRLLEIPKARLKAIQRRLLHNLLDHIPPHPAAHGYCKGRSVVTFVRPHTGKRVVLHFDLCEFFPSIGAARIRALFETAGYPESVSRMLTGLCTIAVPGEVVDARPAVSRGKRPDASLLLRPHLPHGAPTSPALANLCAFRLDCRLASLSHAVGATYTRYADDLLFSGDERLERAARRFHVHACRIALEEGFEINTRKSHFMRQGVRQQVAGIVLNAHPNLAREEYDVLKATLTNCVRHGWRCQNHEGNHDFRGHLAGRIAYLEMVHPTRGLRLKQISQQIRWD